MDCEVYNIILLSRSVQNLFFFTKGGFLVRISLYIYKNYPINTIVFVLYLRIVRSCLYMCVQGIQLKFTNTYPVLSKLWKMVITNEGGLNDQFVMFKKWKNKSHEDIRDSFIQIEFEKTISQFVQSTCYYPSFTDHEVPNVALYMFHVVVGQHRLLFVRCAHIVVLCNIHLSLDPNNVYFQNYLCCNNLSMIKANYESQRISGQGIILTSEDSIQYEDNVWFVNTYRPFLAYPDGFFSDRESVNRTMNIPFYKDFKNSYRSFCKFRTDCSSCNGFNQIGAQGYNTCFSIENPKFKWEFIECLYDNERIVIVTGFKHVFPNEQAKVD